MEMKDQQEIQQYHLRLPKELKEKLEEQAKHDRRSLNQYLVLVLERSLRSPEKATV